MNGGAVEITGAFSVRAEPVEAFLGVLQQNPNRIFLGIIIRMFHRDYNPRHFHANYQGQNATFDFDGKLLEGEFDFRTAKNFIKKWTRLHKPELNNNWEQMRQNRQFTGIEPLKWEHNCRSCNKSKLSERLPD